MDELIGTIFDERYKILDLLEKGEMGVIYKAQQLIMERTVAIKLLPLESTTNVDAINRFRRETKAIALLNHPNIAAVYDSGVTGGGQLYLVMEFLTGKSLRQVLDQDGTLDWRRAVTMFAQVCDGMEHAHRQGVIHRTLNPESIVIEVDTNNLDHLKIRDFGLAKLLTEAHDADQSLTPTSALFSDPRYVSPEQFRAAQPDAASDQYSLACVLYESLSGKPPFDSESIMVTELPTKPTPIRSAQPASKVPDELEKVVFKAMEKESHLRYASMASFKDALLASAGRTPSSQNTWSGRLRLAAMVGLVICLIALGAGVWTSLHSTIDGRITICRVKLAWQRMLGGWDDTGTLEELVGLYRKERNYSKAIETYKELLTVTLNKYGKNSLMAARAYTSLARLCAEGGNIQGFEQYLQTAMQIIEPIETVLEREHKYARNGKEIYRNLYEVWRPILDTQKLIYVRRDDPRLFRSQYKVAYYGRTDLTDEEIIVMLEPVPGIARVTMQTPDSELLGALDMLGICYANTGRSEKDIEVRQVYVELARVLNAEPAFTRAAYRLGRDLVQKGRYKEGEKLLKEAVDYAPYDSDLILAQAYLAECLAAEGKYDQAESRLSAALAVCRKTKDPDVGSKTIAEDVLAPMVIICQLNADMRGAQKALEELRKLGLRDARTIVLDSAGRMAKHLRARHEDERAKELTDWAASLPVDTSMPAPK